MGCAASSPGVGVKQGDAKPMQQLKVTTGGQQTVR
eukprot:COSAG05_NODE_20162_length_282_cov_0.846995_1_plen_34_part_01